MCHNRPFLCISYFFCFVWVSVSEASATPLDFVVWSHKPVLSLHSLAGDAEDLSSLVWARVPSGRCPVSPSGKVAGFHSGAPVCNPRPSAAPGNQSWGSPWCQSAVLQSLTCGWCVCTWQCGHLQRHWLRITHTLWHWLCAV